MVFCKFFKHFSKNNLEIVRTELLHGTIKLYGGGVALNCFVCPHCGPLSTLWSPLKDQIQMS